MSPLLKPSQIAGAIRLTPSERRKQRVRLWESRHHVCALCGKIIWEFEDMELDHIIPKGMGGSNRDDRDENQQLTHCLCNREKGSKRLQDGP